MESKTNLIVMLTYQDRTVENAREIFEQCHEAEAEYWGFKEAPLPPEQMEQLYRRMKECGKKTALEVVAYSEQEGLEGARLAARCGCDLLMGTLYADSILAFCREHGIRYMPFVGRVTGRPSVLEGTPAEMIAQARACLEKGVFGFDLLGYRYTGDATALIRTFVEEVKAPVCVAGSVDSYEKLDQMKAIAPWAFTIGSAFFDKKFGDDFRGQIDRVCRYIRT